MRWLGFVVWTVATLPLSASGDDFAVWPRFRGPNGSGVAAEGHVYPTTFGRSSHMLWSTSLPGGHSSPCIWHDRIFVTAHSTHPDQLETLALERATGRILWRRSLTTKVREKIHSVNNAAASSPACDDRSVYSYFGSFGLVCYEHDGKERWQRPMSVPVTTFGSAASPIVTSELVILGFPGKGAHVLAIDRTTGDTKWKNDSVLFAPSYSVPIVWENSGRKDLIVQGAGGLSACDLGDGSVRWWVAGLPPDSIPSPTADGSMLFAGASIPGGDPDHRFPTPAFDEMLKEYDTNKDGVLERREIPRGKAVYAREGAGGVGDITLDMLAGMVDVNKDKRVGRLEWALVKTMSVLGNDTLLAIRPGGQQDATRTHVAWRETRGLPETPSPLLYRGRVYMVKNGGILTCLDAKTGRLIYRGRAGASAAYYASPVAADGKVYLASEPGVVTVLDARADALTVLARNDLGDSISATPALVDGIVYVRTRGALHAFGERK